MKIKKRSEVRIENIDLPAKPSQEPQQSAPIIPQNSIPIQKPTRKQVFQNFNDDPKTKHFGAIAVPRSVYIFLWVALILIVLLLAVNVFWSNINVSTGKMKGDVSVNVPERSMNATFNNLDYTNYTIPVKVDNNVTLIINVGDEIAKKIADEVRKIINGTNSSG